MSLNPLVASENIIEKYLRYIETTFYIDNKDYMKQFKSYLEKKEFFAKGPYLDFSDSWIGYNKLDSFFKELLK